MGRKSIERANNKFDSLPVNIFSMSDGCTLFNSAFNFPESLLIGYWFDHHPSCFYGGADGIITSYN